jgi:hypothetical protein
MKRLTFVFLFISIFSQAQEKVNFTEKFKKQHQGKYKIEINEVKGLLQIMIAITKTGLENDDMMQQDGAYYQDVIKHFKPYENEPIIKTFDSLLVITLINNVFLTGNGISYNFKGDKLVKSDIYLFPSKGVNAVRVSENPITIYKKQLEDFAKKTNFRSFYKKHKKYYANIIAEYEAKANLGRQWKWLEKNFDTRINAYTIYCSPLINGLNYTSEFNQNNFRLIYMSLPPLSNYPNMSEIENELFNTRVMFTEIDHNYVGKPTNEHKELINKTFKDRKEWVNEPIEGVSAYSTPKYIFDEYMTYGVYLLYCKEGYSEADFQRAFSATVQVMADRGFTKMKEFTTKLLEIQLLNPSKKIEYLYPEFLRSF